MTTERKNITQPSDWWVAVKTQMARDKETNLSKWIGECVIANLDDDLKQTLSPRPPANRPVKNDARINRRD